MTVYAWLSNNYIEVFGAITGIIYVFLEIRQTIWLWPVGIITSAVYILVFFTSKLYADMSLQVYYLIISCMGWYWWAQVAKHRTQSIGLKAKSDGENEETGWKNGKMEEQKGKELQVTRLKLRTGVVLAAVFIFLFAGMWFILSKLTDSPVPVWDSFLTSLSIIATWMLARKIYEHWFLWIVANTLYAAMFMIRGLYPTVILYIVYCVMSFAGLKAWKKTISYPTTSSARGKME